MKHVRLWMFAAILSLCGLTITSCSNDDDETNTPSWTNKTLHCTLPTYLVKGDKIALISPSYFTPMENVEKTSEVLRRWGFNLSWDQMSGKSMRESMLELLRSVFPTSVGH